MQSRRVRAIRSVSAAALVFSTSWGAGAAPRTYGLDDDPIRLGTKALAESRMADARASFDAAIADGYKIDQAKYGLAEIAVREGRSDLAESLYRDAIAARKGPGGFPEASAALGLLLLREERKQEAAAQFDLALGEKPDLWPAIYGRARLLLDEGKVAEAEPMLRKGAKQRGLAEGEDKYHYGMALLHAAKGELAKAEPEALLAMHLNPAEPDAGALLARIYESRGEPTLAIDAYERLLATPGPTPTAPMLHALGRLYQRGHRYNEARDRYLEAVDVDSTYAPALRDLADVHRLAKQYDKAARIYLRYLAAVPDDVDARVRFAETCIALGQYGPAADAAREAASRDSTRLDARFALARAGIRSSAADVRAEAAGLFATLPDSLPWTAADYVALATFEADAKNPEAAQKSVARALALEPGLPAAHFQQGLLDLGAGRADSAVAALERAVRGSPDTPLYHLNLGIAYYQAKRIPDSIPVFRRALELRPDMTAGRLLLAQALAVSDSVASARKEFLEVLDVEPENAKALRGLGFCYIHSADYEPAVRAYEKAAKVEPGNADAWAGLGNAYLGLQNWEAAEKAFERARAIDPANATLRKGLELLERTRSSRN